MKEEKQIGEEVSTKQTRVIIIGVEVWSARGTSEQSCERSVTSGNDESSGQGSADPRERFVHLFDLSLTFFTGVIYYHGDPCSLDVHRALTIEKNRIPQATCNICRYDMSRAKITNVSSNQNEI